MLSIDFLSPDTLWPVIAFLVGYIISSPIRQLFSKIADSFTSSKAHDSWDFNDNEGNDDDDESLSYRITVYKHNGEVLFVHEGKFNFEEETPGYVDYTDEYGKDHSIHAMSGFIKIDEL